MGIREEIKAHLDIVEVIGQFVALRQQGKNYVGLCPFHQERSPSFSVNREGQFFHCFGCKAGGDVIAFWMRYHDLSFGDAIQDICARFRIPVENFTQMAHYEVKAILGVNMVANEFFQKALLSPKTGKEARAYLTKRGLKKEIIEAFQLGYAPNGWDMLATYLRKKGLLEEGIKAGLLGNKGANTFDRFRNRIMFPLLASRGEIVGFGGRILQETDREPKYLNTPETSAFQKRKYLYGLYQGLNHIRRLNSVIFVEGYMDLITLHAYEFKNCVATLGTSVTKEHIKAVQTYAKEMILLFDGDMAGQTAMLRVLPLFLNLEINPKVVILPEGKDPDAFLREKGFMEFASLLDSSMDAVRFYTEYVKATYIDRQDQIKGIRALLKVMEGVSSPILKGEYLRKISEYMEIPYELLYSEMKNITEGKSEVVANLAVSDTINVVTTKDLEALNLFFHNPELLRLMSIESFSRLCLSEPTVGLLQKMKEFMGEKDTLDVQALMEVCTEQEACALREVILSQPIFVSEDVSIVFDYLSNKIMSSILHEKIQKAKQEGNLEMINVLLKQKAQLLENFSQIL